MSDSRTQEMGFEVTYLEDQGIVHTKIVGEQSTREVEAMLEEQHRISEERGCKLFLTDLTDGIPVDKLVDIFSFSRLYEEAGLPRSGRKAIIYSKELHDADFFETALYNRGWVVRMFRDFEEAKAWLTQKK